MRAILLRVGAALAFACAAGARGDDAYPIYVYPCPKAEQPPRLDGRFDDPVWAKAPLVSGFTFYNKPTLAEVQTGFRVAYDDRCLYFAVRCDEPLMKRVAPQPLQKDDPAVFHQECIEIFIDPNHTHKTYYQFAFNVAEAAYDSKLTNPAWDSGARIAVARQAASWTLEAAIPWKPMNAAARPGKVVGFNVCRDRLVGRSREWTNWSQTMANFHDPDRFAHLVLSPTGDLLAKLVDEFRKGGRKGPIRIFGQGGYSRTAYIALARRTLADVDRALNDLKRTANKEASPAARKAILAQLAEIEARLAPTRRALQRAASIDAMQWYRLSRDLQKLKMELSETIWRARLTALLSTL